MHGESSSLELQPHRTMLCVRRTRTVYKTTQMIGGHMAYSVVQVELNTYIFLINGCNFWLTAWPSRYKSMMLTKKTNGTLAGTDIYVLAHVGWIRVYTLVRHKYDNPASDESMFRLHCAVSSLRQWPLLMPETMFKSRGKKRLQKKKKKKKHTPISLFLSLYKHFMLNFPGLLEHNNTCLTNRTASKPSKIPPQGFTPILPDCHASSLVWNVTLKARTWE